MAVNLDGNVKYKRSSDDIQETNESCVSYDQTNSTSLISSTKLSSSSLEKNGESFVADFKKSSSVSFPNFNDTKSAASQSNISRILETSPSNKSAQVIQKFKEANISPTSAKPSKQRLQSVKRRAGILYKQLKSSKTCKVESKYFNQAHNTQKRWIPPRSPYSLVQEDLFDKPWQLLVATIFLTKTTAKRALPQLYKFLVRFPLPEDVLQATYEDIDEYFKPLGLISTRSHVIMRFTVEYLEKDWTYPRELYGIGKYGDDSYRMFCINEWRQVSPDDIPLTMYRNWLLENAKKLGID